MSRTPQFGDHLRKERAKRRAKRERRENTAMFDVTDRDFDAPPHVLSGDVLYEDQLLFARSQEDAA